MTADLRSGIYLLPEWKILPKCIIWVMDSKIRMLASGPKVRWQQKIFIILVLNVTQPVDFIILKPQWKKLLKEPSI